MELKDIVDLMNSEDCNDRLKAEYFRALETCAEIEGIDLGM